MKIFLILLSVIILIYYIYNCFVTTIDEPFADVWINGSKKKVINMLKKVINICDKNGIKVVLMYGTLLGQQRHGGLIPWDDDMDVCIKDDDIPMFLSLKDKFKDNGIGLSIINKTFYKLYDINGLNINNYKYKWPFIDFFTYSVKKNKVIISDIKLKSYTFNKKDFFPLKSGNFENIKALIPNNSPNILNKLYSNNWKKKCISSSYNHKLEMSYNKTKTINCSDLNIRFN